MRLKHTLLGIVCLFFSSLFNNANAGTTIHLLPQAGLSGYYTCDSNGCPFTGYNLGGSALLAFDTLPLLSLALGPTLKYETVKGSLSSSLFNHTYSIDETFNTTQAGFEGGVILNLLAIDLYLTGFATYGIDNSLSADIHTTGALNKVLPDQTIHPTVKNSWQSGFNARILLTLIPKLFGMGIGASYFKGQYDCDTDLKVAGSHSSIGSGHNAYTGFNLNLVADIKI